MYALYFNELNPWDINLNRIKEYAAGDLYLAYRSDVTDNSAIGIYLPY
jgi:hypothetical protein